MIQLQGYACEPLSSLTYDVSNADGVLTNQTGYVTDEFWDTNFLAFTTNFFPYYNLALTNGLNHITVHATDLAGNKAMTNFSVTLDYSGDTTAPMLSVIWPTNGTSIAGSNVTVQAQVDDVTATVNVQIVDAGGDTNTVRGLVESSGMVWVDGLPLTDGTNWLTVMATDVVGNMSETSFNVVGNDVNLVVNPLTGGQLNQSSVTVTGTIGASSDTVTINGVQATVNSDGSWEADNVPVNQSGTAGLNVQVADSSNSPLASQTVYQSQPVRVALMSFAGSYSLAGTFDLGATGDSADVTHWTWQSGGSEDGHNFSSGVVFPFVNPSQSNVWDNALAAGDNGFSENGILGAIGLAPGREESYFNGVVNPEGAVEMTDTHVRVMIEPPGQVSADRIITYLVQAQASDKATGAQLAANALTIQNRTLAAVTNSDGSVWGQMLLDAPAGARPDVTPLAAGNYTFNVQAFTLDTVMAVDNSRDGSISFDNNDATSPQSPFPVFGSMIQLKVAILYPALKFQVNRPPTTTTFRMQIILGFWCRAVRIW